MYAGPGRLYAVCMDLDVFGGMQMHGDARRSIQLCMVAGRIWWSVQKRGCCIEAAGFGIWHGMMISAGLQS
jgi:hypothetical protein